MSSGCTLLGTAAGPFVGVYARGKTYAKDLDSDRLHVLEKIGLTLALPISIGAGAAEGLIVGPFVGMGADLEYLSTGKIDLSRFEEKFSDATEKYEPKEKKQESEKPSSPQKEKEKEKSENKK
jgi:hypothetical protein